MLRALHSGIFLSSVFFVGIFTFPDLLQLVIRPDSQELPVISQTPNHAPRIKIIEPSGKTSYAWNELVPYSIEISDQEDGESKYQEIQSSEVLVKLKYVGNQAMASAYFLKQKKISDSAVVNSMMISNCFNCHTVKVKLAGPSFLDISKRYLNTINNRDQLVKHIQNGSKGIWGKEVMPTHPELTDSEARQMVKWILVYAKDPGLNYFVGLQGALPLNKPAITTHQGLFIITAFYTDHGSADFPDRRLTGSDQMIIQMK